MTDKPNSPFVPFVPNPNGGLIPPRDPRIFRITNLALGTTTPVKTSAEARACGKVIVAGEHAVVYGAKALAIPLLSKYMHIKIYADLQASGAPKIRFNLGDRPVQESLREMVLEALEILALPRCNLSMEGHSNLMLGAGVGSSASLCVTVLRGLLQLAGRTMTPNELARAANQLERRFHGNPSGLDTAVVALEQAIMFERGKDPDVVRVQKPKNSRFPWTFVLLDSGLRSPTINMVRQAEPFFRREGAKLIDAFNNITTSCKDAFETGDVALMAQAMNEAQDLLTTAGVVTPPLDDIASAAKAIGALATKITGAGGGGCMLTLLVNDRCDEQIAKFRDHLGNDRVHPLFIP